MPCAKRTITNGDDEGMKVSSKIVLAMLLMLMLSAIAITFAQPISVGDAQTSVYTAYNALVNAYNAGADISKLTVLLNQAINLTSQAQALASANPQQSQTLASQAQGKAENVTTQAAAAKLNGPAISPLVVAVLAAVLVVCGCVVYVYGPGLLWKGWFRFRKNYHVAIKKTPGKSKGLAITWEEVCAVILGITVIIALVATVPFFLPRGSSEQFSELGVLGPNMQLGDYPSQVVAGQPVSLYVYVGNQMNEPMYYDVMIKLGDNNTVTDPAPITAIQQFSSVVPCNGTWTFPVNVTLMQAGLNQRILFELWIYNSSISQLQYNQRWGEFGLTLRRQPLKNNKANRVTGKQNSGAFSLQNAFPKKRNSISNHSNCAPNCDDNRHQLACKQH